MVAPEEEEPDAVAIHADARRLLLFFLGAVVLVAVSAWTLAREPEALWAWGGVLLFGVGGGVATYRMIRLGVLAGRPLLVVGRAGIRDNRLRLTLPWDDVAGLELWEQYIPRGPSRPYLGVRTKRDPLADHRRLRAPLQAAMHVAAGSASTPAPPELSLPLSELALDPAEVVDVVRRYWNGPISGLAIAREARAARNPWYRIVTWSLGLIVGVGTGFLWFLLQH